MKYKNWIFGKDGALLRAAATGRLDLIEELISEGANLNVVSCNGYTPIHRAAQNGHTAIVEFLLNEGAIADAESSDHQTPQSLAETNGHKDIVTMLSRKQRKP